MAKTNEPLRFKTFFNPDKQPGDKQPILKGSIAFPNITGKNRDVTLWSNVSRTGMQYFSGHISPDPEKTPDAKSQLEYYTKPQDELENLVDYTIKVPIKDGQPPRVYKPLEIVLYSNPNYTPENKQPTHFGYTNPGHGEPLQSIGAWLAKDKNGAMMLTGNVQEWEPRKEKDPLEQMTSDPEPEEEPEDALEMAR